ncbi:methyl-accepting chemotaxis protein [Pantoea anthophila]|uniref:methyl-accepting chemotaxis protein n=1 Tax=Pantoea anthophila TaxID=470931 RepID=UPI002787BCA7|nr:methyl-accepting chemotaxis protein [Pantoea anthophila]MDQ1213491.1 methyl-accepting chemotaxis protein-1 (serine sensor receptor) [Pantoea anthophila]
MFKNLKISTGINALMMMFVLFLALISFFNFTSVHRFNHQAVETIAITTASNALQDAVNDLNNAVGVTVSATFNERVNFDKTGTRTVDKHLIANIDGIIAKANGAFKAFKDRPEISHNEHEMLKKVDKAYTNLLNFTVSMRDILNDSQAQLPSPTELEKKTSQYRFTIREQMDQYGDELDALLAKHQQKINEKNQMVQMIASTMVVISVILVIIARIWLRKSVFDRLRKAQETFSQLASGDLSQPIAVGAKNEIGDMLMELEKMRRSLTSTVADIRQGVDRIHGSAQEIATSNNELSSRTEQQACALQQTAASMEELKITVRQNADNAHSARQLVESANNSARKGGDVMVKLDSIMQEITENSRQIADINGVIDSIANQTNILALNAAVEAARAGEQGRGFAVVAGEVRSLAKRSADAAKEIRQLINVCVTNMNTGSQEVEQAGAAMVEVVKSVTQVTDIMSEITSASDEQSTGISQIAQAVNEMDSVTQQNASMVEQAASIARNVETYADDLEHAVALFSLEKKASVSEERSSNSVSSATIKKPVAPGNESRFSKSNVESDWTSF